MSVNPTMPKEINLLTSEFRFSEIEARLSKHEELLKTVENLTKKLNEIKTQLVKIIYVNFIYIISVKMLQLFIKGIE